MYNTYFYLLIISLLLSLVLTPAAKKLSFLVGAVDIPNERKVHKKPMARMGGISIGLSFVITVIFGSLYFKFHLSKIEIAVLVGGVLVLLTGGLDDKFQIAPWQKLIGQFCAACVVTIGFGLHIDFIHLPFISEAVRVGWWGVPLSIVWIVAVTNAINLIDGLDGLAAGVSAISCGSLFIISVMMGTESIALLTIVLIGSLLGFLFFNFEPAKIFMGDSGSLFLGFALATMSLTELKQATMVAFIGPMLVLGIPISDTLYAMIRRYANKKPLFQPDKNHLHHCLINIGFSVKKTVLIIYGISSVFSFLAILLNQLSIWLSVVLVALYLIGLEIFAESIDLLDNKRKPIVRLFKKIKTFVH